LSPGEPEGPGEPGTLVFVKRCDCEVSGIVLVSDLSVGLDVVSDLSVGLDVVSDCDVDLAKGTSKTVCNEENKSVTTIQILSRFVIDDGRGLDSDPIVSENIPLFTLR
jgi:hypothetical protein